MSLFKELKRRNVFRAAAAYVVAAWLIIQVVETIFPAFGFGDAAVRVVTIVLAVCLIPALVLAWIFELTPEGLKREKDLDRNQPVDGRYARRADRVIMGTLAVAVAYFGIDKFVVSQTREARIAEQARNEARSEADTDSYSDKSIAVLAFDDLSIDGGQQYLSEGIAEQLLNMLTRTQGLRVISRASAFSYKGKDVRLSQIAEELNVGHVLAGSVRRAGNRVRVSVQLVDARTDTALWSETYDRTLSDIFAIEDEIASSVAEQLKVTLFGDRSNAHVPVAEAHAAFLQARYLGRQHTAAGFEESNALYQRALAVDANYASAWTGLAQNYINMANAGILTYDQGYSRATEAAGRALTIDPDHASAHSILGWVAMGKDLASSARHIQRALELQPTDLAIISNASALLANLGRFDEAIAVDEYLTVRDPLNPVSYNNLGASYLSARRWDDAIAAFETVLRLSPGYIGAHYWMGTAQLFKGDIQVALESMHRELLDGYRLIGLAMAHHAAGEQEASDTVLAALISKYEQAAAYNIAYVLAYRGEVDRAFEWLNKAVEYRDGGLSAIVRQPEFENLRSDPRWTAIMDSLGKSQGQLDAIEFAVDLPKHGPAFEASIPISGPSLAPTEGSSSSQVPLGRPTQG